MNIKLIRNDKDLRDAFKRLEFVYQAKEGTPEADEMEGSRGKVQGTSFVGCACAPCQVCWCASAPYKAGEVGRTGRGWACLHGSFGTDVAALALDLADEITSDNDISARCRALSAKLFSPAAVVKQIAAALTA